MSYSETILINLGASQTGLTLQAQLYTPGTLTTVGDPITDGFVEKGLGVYSWTNPTDWDDDAHYDIKFQEVGDTSIAAWTTINPRSATRTEATADKQAILTAVAGLSGGAGGTGANAVHITITDGTDPLEGVTVRVTKGAESFVLSTDSSGRAGGEAGFSLDNGTWEVRATLFGYTLAVQQLVVTGDTSISYAMTQLVSPTSEPGLVTGRYLVLVNGVATADVAVSAQQIKQALKGDLATGLVSFGSEVRTATSDTNGYAHLVNLIPGAAYNIWSTGTGKRRVEIPSDAEGTVELLSLLS